MIGCCPAAQYKFYKEGTRCENQYQETVDFVGGLINGPQSHRGAAEIDNPRLAAALTQFPASRAHEIKSCDCACHIDNMGCMC
jgi:hypothetical protein